MVVFTWLFLSVKTDTRVLGEISFVMTGNTFDRGCGGDLNNGITSEKCVTGSGWEQAGSVSVDDVSDVNVTTAQII